MNRAGHASMSPPARSRAWQVVAGIACLLAAAAVLHFLADAYQKYTLLDPASYGMFWPRRAWLWTHLAGGATTVLLGALQFLGRLRAARPAWHRWIGRLYLAGVVVGSIGAAGLVATSPAPVAIRLAFAATGLAWIVTSATGFIAIRGGQVQVHRRWMIRSYLVTLAPVTFRVALHAPGLMALASPVVMIPLLLWLSWVVPLLAYEAIRALSRTRGRATAPRSQPA